MPRRRFNRTVVIILLGLLPIGAGAADAWRTLFNGKDLTGWKPNVYPDSWSVADGSIRAKASKAGKR